MTNHVPTLGRVVGQRCLDCKGAVKWSFGHQPGHVYAQDFIGTKSVGQGQAELRTSIERTKRKSLIDPDRMAAVVAAISWYNATDPLAAEVAP